MKTVLNKCPTCGYKQKRSTQANRLYWRILGAIASTVRLENGLFSPDSWHCYFKFKFLGADDFRLPSGEVITQPRSTADLDVAQFAVYVESVMAWAANEGVFLDDQPMRIEKGRTYEGQFEELEAA